MKLSLKQSAAVIFCLISSGALLCAGDTPVRLLALGDSYTVGEGIEPADSWPEQAVRLLRQYDVTLADPMIIAKTGWTASDLQAALEQAQPPAHFTVVAILIGVNNQFRGLNLEDYRREFKALVTRAGELASGNPARVVVLSIPDWSVTPLARGYDQDAISKSIERFNEVNRAEAELAGAMYIYITPLTRRVVKESGMMAEDGLHYAKPMYAQWAERVAAAVRVALEK